MKPEPWTCCLTCLSHEEYCAFLFSPFFVWGFSHPRQEFCHLFHYSCSSMARFSKVRRERAIGMMTTGMKQVNSSKILHLQECLAYTGKADDHPRSFRPCVTPGIQDQNIPVTHLRNCSRPVKITKIETPETYDNRISGLTKRNWLKHPGSKCLHP